MKNNACVELTNESVQDLSALLNDNLNFYLNILLNIKI